MKSVGNTIPVSEAVKRLLQVTPKVKEKLQEQDIKVLWGKAVGEMVQKRTTQIHKKDKTLFVKVSSPAVKHELLYRQGSVIASLNNLLSEDSRINNIFWY